MVGGGRETQIDRPMRTHRMGRDRKVKTDKKVLDIRTVIMKHNRSPLAGTRDTDMHALFQPGGIEHRTSNPGAAGSSPAGRARNSLIDHNRSEWGRLAWSMKSGWSMERPSTLEDRALEIEPDRVAPLATRLRRLRTMRAFEIDQIFECKGWDFARETQSGDVLLTFTAPWGR